MCSRKPRLSDCIGAKNKFTCPDKIWILTEESSPPKNFKVYKSFDLFKWIEKQNQSKNNAFDNKEGV